jgi:hypothetical protein
MLARAAATLLPMVASNCETAAIIISDMAMATSISISVTPERRHLCPIFFMTFTR